MLLKNEISDGKQHQQKTSSMVEEISNVVSNIFITSIVFAASLATTFAVYSATVTITFLLSFIKSLINIFTFTCCKSITNPSSSSKTGTFSPSPTKPIPNRYHVRHQRYISSLFLPESLPTKTVLPKSSKKTLFLGLFRILVNFTVNQPCDQFDFVVHPVIKGKIRACYVVKRPGLDELLRAAKNASVEIVIYTSARSEFAGPIIDGLDPTRKLITHRLYQNACIERRNGLFIKNLVLTGRQLHRSMIIDDHPKVHVKQWANAIAVRPFFRDHADTDLINLVEFFETERNFNDLWHLIQLKNFGITSHTSNNSEEFGMAAYWLSLLQSLNLSSSFRKFAHAKLCLDFQTSSPLLEQSLQFIAPFRKLTQGIDHLNSLVKITLKDSKLPEKTIQVLQRLPNLTALSLIVRDSYNEKDLKFPARTFQKVEILNFEDQGNLSSMTFEEQCMPELKELSASSPNFNFVVTGIGNLPKLKKIKVQCG